MPSHIIEKLKVLGSQEFDFSGFGTALRKHLNDPVLVDQFYTITAASQLPFYNQELSDPVFYFPTVM